MPKLQELVDQRVTIITNARKTLDEIEKSGRDANAEEMAAFNKAMDEADGLKRQVDDGLKAEQAAAEMANRLKGHEDDLRTLNRGQLNRVAGSAVNSGFGRRLGGDGNDPLQNAADHEQAVRGWFLNQYHDEVPDECIEAARRCGLNLRSGTLDTRLHPKYDEVRTNYFNALQSNDPAKGGALRLGSLLGPLEKALLDFGPMLQVADVIRTSDGKAMPWPTINNTSNKGRQVGESASVADAVDPATAAQVWGAYKYMSDLIKVPYELIRDSSVNLPQLLGELQGEAISRIINERATTGSGQATMRGYVTRSYLGKTAAANNAITADEIIDLQHSVPSAYRQGAEFMANDATWKLVRKLKSNDNQYLLQPGLQLGMPDRVLGWVIRSNDDMATVAASAKVMVAGQPKRYKLRMVNRIRMYRLEERFRTEDQDGFLCFIECDGDLLDAGTHPVRHLIMNT